MSSPGVRIVTASGRPPTRISSGSSTTSVSGRLTEVSPSMRTTGRRVVIRPIRAPGVAGSSRITIDFDVGVFDVVAVLSSGTSTFVSGKYAAAHPRATGKPTVRKPGARRSPPLPSSPTRSTIAPSPTPSSARSSGCTNITRRPLRMPR